MKCFRQGWALANPPQGHLTCAVEGWVIGFSFVDILTVGKQHALSCPDIQNWCPRVMFMHQEHIRLVLNCPFFSNSSYNEGWIDLLCAEALLYVLGRDVNLSFFASAIS